MVFGYAWVFFLVFLILIFSSFVLAAGDRCETQTVFFSFPVSATHRKKKDFGQIQSINRDNLPF